VTLFLGLRVPKQTSTVKSINEIRAFGEFILLNFTHPVGECISESSLKEILLIFNDVNDNDYSGRDEFDNVVSNKFDTVLKYYTDGYHEYNGGWIKIPETGIIYDKIPHSVSPLLSTKSVFFEYRKKL
jgi:hypothetical protein